MKLSRTAAYAVHAMVYMAQHPAGPLVVGHVAAKDLGIPGGFLFRILVALSRAGVLRSMKGPNGGYNLARPAKGITLLDIIEAAEGPILGQYDPTSSPPNALDKRLQAVADAAKESVRMKLASVTLADLVGSGKKGR